MTGPWPCGGWPMGEPATLRLQRALASLVLDAAPELPQDLPPGDQAALGEPRLGTYRELARRGLLEPVETDFPVLKALLAGAGAWEACAQAFLAARVVHSPHYRDIPSAFLGWLADSGWGRDRWPFLLELAHMELLEVVVARFPDLPPAAGLPQAPSLDRGVALDPATQVVAYGHAVHRATEAEPMPEALPTRLLAFRTPEGEVRVLELTEATAALLVRAQTQPLGEALAGLGLPDPGPAMALLEDLRHQGAVVGFPPFSRVAG